MDTAILIPARLNSKRLPNKPTVKLNGVPLVRRVAEACAESGYPVFVLTDSAKVTACVRGFETVLDQDMVWKNGTERCAAASYLPQLDHYKYFVNVQGDMPDITPTMIDMVVDTLRWEKGAVATLYTKMTEEEQRNRHNVKMVHNEEVAHWFARDITYGAKHLGIYGYENNTLKEYLEWDASLYEEIENLEQLRWIENEIPICVSEVQFNGVEINTVGDVHSWHLRNKFI